MNSSKDVKGKGKLVSDHKAPIKKSETNSKKVEKKFVKNQIKNKQKQSSAKETNLKDNRIKVFTITKEDSTTLTKHTYMVDLAFTFPLSIKGSHRPKQLWVPKCA